MSFFIVLFFVVFVYLVEKGIFSFINSYVDVLWWVMLIIIMVGYGDMYLVIGFGCGVVVFLMLIGIILFGLLIVSVVFFFVEDDMVK